MHTHKEIDYIEFCVTDITEVKHFYAKAFGWKFTEYSPTYVGIKGSKKEMGGFTVVGKIKQGSILPVIYTNNLEESMKAVQRTGGTIVKNIFSFPGGRRFQFNDPSGNTLAVWSDK